jgi:catechol 2,3-dioxygenase
LIRTAMSQLDEQLRATPGLRPDQVGPSSQTEPSVAVSLPPATGVGTVHLSVTDGPRALAFYRDVVGLTPMVVDTTEIHLGAGSRELVVLYPGAAGPVARNKTGLYHLALVVPNRKELARVVARLGSMRVPQSPTDHTMTKSDYLWDLDGNGIEIYAESPEDGTWLMANGQFGAIDKNGRMRSGRDPIDLPELFNELSPDDRLDAPLPPETKMGHVHLHVRNVDEAVHFYHDLVGFDVTGVVPELGVAFVSAGGYHHHLGLNTWAGPGAPPAPAGSAGLRHFTIELPSPEDLAELRQRLTNGGVEVTEKGEGVFTEDPSKNHIELKVRAA